ncbi:MAG: hypothetical protein HUJ92_05005 [Bacteroidales bacterium]|nr:hypothetical protein [Bacteroidales bacterium]
MNRKIQFFATIFLSFTLAAIIPAKTFAKVTKEEKEMIKKMVKDNGYRNAEMKETDDVRYILIEVEKNKFIVADQLGKIIIKAPDTQSKGYNDITLFESNARGRKNYRYQKKGGMLGFLSVETHEAFFPGNQAVFCAEAEGCKTDFYAIDGTLINSLEATCELAPEMQIFIINDIYNLKGVATVEGNIVVKPLYEGIEAQESGLVYFTKTIEGVRMCGAVDFRGNAEDQIPCKFFDITHDNGHWMVQTHRGLPFNIFDPADEYEVAFADDGQKYFDQGEYAKCRDYYTLRAPEAELAQFYVGLSDHELAINILNDIEKETKELGKDDPSKEYKKKDRKGENRIKYINELLSECEASLRSATSNLDKYAKTGVDKSMTQVAKEAADGAFAALNNFEDTKKSVKKSIDQFYTKQKAAEEKKKAAEAKKKK